MGSVSGCSYVCLHSYWSKYTCYNKMWYYTCNILVYKRMHLYTLNILLLLCLCNLQPVLGQAFDAERIFLSTEKENCMPSDTLSADGVVMSTAGRRY